MRQTVAVIVVVLCCGSVPLLAADDVTAAPVVAMPDEVMTAHVLPVPVFALRSLYVSYAALSVLDFQTTRMALNSGNFHEANSLVSPVAGNAVALLALKGVAVASAIYLTERLRPHHPAMAVTAIVAANIVGGLVVTHNVMTINGRPTGIPGQ